MSKVRIKTPCIGMCSTTYGDLVCRGCKRFAHEIVDWNGYGDGEKLAVLRRLIALRDQVVTGVVRITDPEQLARQLAERRIVVPDGSTDATRVFELLRRGARFIRRMEAYGFRPLPEHEQLDAVAVRDHIDSQFLALSEAYYRRFVAPEAVTPEALQACPR